ncbi:putative DNA-directed RNA polymerase I subunit RPA34.5 [Seiridium cardinale]|uniref:DNA-directed RNA polymerase I subunit RPA34.5 n=1 Tax=Seiridium cardinale TaxID=138064 RepID=A0ABR2XH70_9PEZI
MAPKKFIGSLSAMAKNIKEKATTNASSASRPGTSTTFKSAELVQDSDTSSSDDSSSGSENDSGSEDSLEAAKKKLEAKNAAKKAAAPRSQVNGKSATTTAAKKAIAKKPASNSSSDDSSDSESESDSNDKSAKPASKPSATKKAEPVQASSATSDSESDSDSDSDSDAGAKVTSIAGAIATKASQAKATLSAKESSKDAEESSESGSDSEDDDEADSRAVARVNGASETTDIAKPEWLSKSDFMLRKASSENPGKEVSEFLSKSNLEGKQVWYFTAPASLPITVIKDMEIDLAKAQSGGAILNHQGDAYGLDLEPYTTSSQIQLLIPSKGGDKYNNLNRAIDSTVHLRRIAEFGGASKVSSTATDQYVRQPKPIREQPKNLKARFTPIGVPTKKPVPPTKATPVDSNLDSSSSSGSDSDVEMTNATTIPTAEAKSNSKTAINGTLKRKQPVEKSSSDSDSSSDESDDELPPSKKTKSPEKPTKRTKVGPKQGSVKPKTTSSAPAVQAENTAIPSSQISAVPKGSEATKSTPIPPPKLARSISEASGASGTPSKVVESSKSKKDKKPKKYAPSKGSDSTPKAVSQTPIPVPKFGVGS